MRFNLHIILSSVLLMTAAGAIGLGVYRLMQEDQRLIKSEVLGESISSDVESSRYSLVPIRSNQWYSSIYKNFPTDPMYAFPLAYRISTNGLEISYPQIKTTPDTVFASFTKDLTVGFEDKFNRPKIKSIGDWSILLSLSASSNSLDVFIAHGLPYTVVNVNGSEPVKIIADSDLKIFQHEDLTTETKLPTLDSALLFVHGKYYAVFTENTSTVAYTDNSLSIKDPGKIIIALLDKPKDFETFNKYKNFSINDTRVDMLVKDTTVETKYSIESDSHEEALITLMPHQYDTLSEKFAVLGEYESLRGPLKLIATKSFVTSVHKYKPENRYISALSNTEKIQTEIKKDVQTYISESLPDSKNYYLGTWFGKGANLLLLTEAYNLSEEHNKLRAYILPLFKDSLSYYEYSESLKSLISKKPEFGNEELNDHHFHYGYYIYLASILFDDLTEKEKAVIQEMVGDIATGDRSSSRFPFLRTFDIYEGHSWADGYADSADGNNQESTSEAIFAWYSIYQWGEKTGDSNLSDIGMYLYNSEINSALYYWFDISGIYGSPYKHEIASIIWGGKVDFATWFSGKTNMIYGIQLLPVSPAIEYIKDIPDFEKYSKDYLSSGSIEDEWADLYLIWKSYHSEVDEQEIPKNLKHNDRVPNSLLLHMINSQK